MTERAAPLLVVAFDDGGLGNRLTLFAHFLALCQGKGFQLINPSFGPFASFFEGTARNGLCAFTPDGMSLENPALDRFVLLFKEFVASVVGSIPGDSQLAKRVCALSTRELCGEVDPGIRELLRNFVVLLASLLRVSSSAPTNPEEPQLKLIDSSAGCLDLSAPSLQNLITPRGIFLFDSWDFRFRKDFAAAQPLLRSYFTPCEPMRTNVARRIAAARLDCERLIGIHIRRGDYECFEGGKYFYQLEDYRGIMRQILSQNAGRRITFFVSSTERLTEADFPGLPVHFGSGEPVEDMYALAATDYIFGPPSTFSTWARDYSGVPYYPVESLNAPLPSLPQPES